MLKLRFVIFGAGAALVLGMGSALAMQTGAGGNDSHGDTVASAARTTCPHGPDGVHGHCVSAIASSKSQGGSNDSNSNKNATCKNGDASEDSSETAGATAENGRSNSTAAGRSAAKSARNAAKAEDQSERTSFTACVSANSAGESETADSETGS